MPLFGLALAAARRWLEVLPEYARRNPEALVFPTRKGRRRAPGKNLYRSIWCHGKVHKIDIFQEHLLTATIAADRRHDGRPVHMIRFHGVLAPNAKLRKQAVASARPSVAPNAAPAAKPLQLPLLGAHFEPSEPSEADVRHARCKPWAWLLRHVFAVDVAVCPECAGTMKWRHLALTADAIRQGLVREGLSTRGPPKLKRAPLGQLALPFPTLRRM